MLIPNAYFIPPLSLSPLITISLFSTLYFQKEERTLMILAT